jgi:hypothetical protein
MHAHRTTCFRLLPPRVTTHVCFFRRTGSALNPTPRDGNNRKQVRVQSILQKAQDITRICKVSKTFTYVARGLLPHLVLSVAHITTGFSLTASVGAIVNCLFLVGACSAFCNSGCLHTRCLLSLAALRVDSMWIGQTRSALTVLLGLLQMNCMLCLSALLYSL